MLGVIVDNANLFLVVDLEEPAWLLPDGSEVDAAIRRFLPWLTPFATHFCMAVALERRFAPIVPERVGAVAVSRPEADTASGSVNGRCSGTPIATRSS